MQLAPAQKSRKRAKDFRSRLRHVAARGDVENAVERIEHAKLARHTLRMARGAVRENELAPLKPRDRRRKLRHMRDRSKIDVVHEIHEDIRLHVMLGHEAGERRAVLVVEVFLHLARRFRIEAEQILDEGAHPLVDLRKQIALGGVERVVEVEDPEPRPGEGFCDAALAARFPIHERRARSTCPRHVR